LCRRHGEPDPEQLIVRLCEELLAECPTDRGPAPLPVLGSCRGVRAYRSELIHPVVGCSGLLIPVDGGYEVIVCSGQPEGRQNFSTAHEIVHTFFREVRPSATPSAEEEDLCNLGAATLTMPAGRFSPFLAARPLSFATLEECQREFAVSLVAAGRRAMVLTDLSACLSIAAPATPEVGSRACTPELRIAKWWWSGRWPFPGSSHVDLPIVQGSVISEVFTHRDQRAERGDLGLARCTGTYDVEAREYGYLLPGNLERRQVLALARGPVDGESLDPLGVGRGQQAGAADSLIAVPAASKTPMRSPHA
jgi:IrrE N-terminal-like domain